MKKRNLSLKSNRLETFAATFTKNRENKVQLYINHYATNFD